MKNKNVPAAVKAVRRSVLTTAIKEGCANAFVKGFHNVMFHGQSDRDADNPFLPVGERLNYLAYKQGAEAGLKLWRSLTGL